MDTKSRKSRPFAAWLCFFLGVSIIGVLLLTGLGIAAKSSGNMDVLKTHFNSDYKNSMAFKERSSQYFNSLFSLVEDNSNHDNSYLEMVKSMLNDEGENVKYCAVNLKTSQMVTNMEGSITFPVPGGMPATPAGYNYFWYLDGQKMWVMDHGKLVDTERLDSGYRGLFPNLSMYTDTPATNSRVLLAVKDTLVKNPYSHSMYYSEQQLLRIIGWSYAALGVLGIAFLVYALIRRRDKRDFVRKIASWSGAIWVEVKILLSILVLALMCGVAVQYGGNYNYFTMITVTALTSIAILLGLWWFYVMAVDLFTNCGGFFRNNSINSMIKWYQKYESKYSWQQSMLKRAYMLVAAETVLALTSVLFVVISASTGDFVPFLIALLTAGTGIYLLYRYLHRYNVTINDLGKLIDHIEMIKAGNMESRLELPTDADMYPAAQNLNALQEGMNMAVTEKMKSERMKIELITNVSHDLKTPLTSIISYVDLLGKEENLSEKVNDYIKILAQKSERLKNLIQDLFDLSKASSGNVSLDTEQLDLARLIKQTLADMEEPISKSGLTFRLNIPDEPVNILSDGKKLYRVWENLITNTLKYSLPGSRVFVELTVDDKGARAAIKNTANYEMNFEEEEILQRFVRGDSSRTTEGSGLGLSIAESFTQLCGGKFEVKIDGDLFKVELLFTTV